MFAKNPCRSSAKCSPWCNVTHVCDFLLLGLDLDDKWLIGYNEYE